MSITKEEIIIQAISHEIRRQILRILHTAPQTFTGLQNYFDITSAKLTYHLKNIQGFVSKDDDGVYHLSPLGEKAVHILANIHEEVTDEEQPMIKEAYLGQTQNKSSLIMNGINIAIGVIGFAILVSSIISIIAITDPQTPILIYPVVLLIVVLEIFGLIWLIRIRQRAPATIEKLQKHFADPHSDPDPNAKPAPNSKSATIK